MLTTLCYVYRLELWKRGKMAAYGVAGYRQIIESVEHPARWKEKTLQAG